MPIGSDGGSGSDLIDVSSASTGLADSVGVNAIQDGSSNDAIAANAAGGEVSGNDSTAIKQIRGGSGDGNAVAGARVISNSGLLARNRLDSGSGNALPVA